MFVMVHFTCARLVSLDFLLLRLLDFVCLRLGCALSFKSYASYPLFVLSYVCCKLSPISISYLLASKESGKSYPFYANIVLNIVLSSNTKKGEIERTFLSLCILMFVDNTMSNLMCVLSIAET